ncbi:MAG: HD-GYP domain-containing protein [Candidatus Eisenbacteria bacterium]
MTVKREENEFAEFIRLECADLVEHLSKATKTALAVLGPEGEVILEVSPAKEGEQSGSGGTSDLAAPIRFSGDPVGRLVAPGGESEIRPLLESLAGEIGNRYALERDLEKMTDDLTDAYDQINLLYRFTRVLRPDGGFSETSKRLLQEAGELVERRLLVLYLPKRDFFTWSTEPGYEPPPSIVWLTENRAALRRIQSELRQEVERAKSPEDARHRGTLMPPPGSVSYMVLPIWVRSDTVGFVGIFAADGTGPIETGEIRILESLAKEISTTVTTMDLRLELRHLLFNVVRSLVNAIEAKDKYTRGHSERVFMLSVRIGERLGLPPDDVQSLSWAALLHDIGKISIDEKILNKPDRLSEEEFERVKSHPVAGCKMLEPIEQLESILPGIRHHHERWDGTGYPDGLRGKDIPLISRVIAVADTYDAIVSARPYRPADTYEYALRVIRAAAGSQFDPKVVSAFLNLVAEGEIGGEAKESHESATS